MTREEDILHALRRLEVMTRRKPEGNTPPPDVPQPSPRPSGRGRMMATLHDCGPMSQTQLAAKLDIRPQSLSELLTKAEAEGLITRRQSEEDKRQTIVSLTEDGRTRVAGFREAHKRRAELFCAPLTDEEKDTLCALLTKLVQAKNDEKGDE